MDALLRWTPSTSSSSEAGTSSDLSATPPGTCFPQRPCTSCNYLSSLRLSRWHASVYPGAQKLWAPLIFSVSASLPLTHTHTETTLHPPSFPSVKHTPVWELTLPETLNTRRQYCSLFFDEPKMTQVSALCLQAMGQIKAFKNLPPLSMNSAFSGSSVLFAVVGYNLCQLLPPRVAQVQNLKQSFRIVPGLSAGLVVRHSRKFHSSALRRGRAECDYTGEQTFWSSNCTPALRVAFTPTKWITFRPQTSICDAPEQLTGPKRCIDNSGGDSAVMFKESLCFIYRRRRQEPVVSQSKSLILMRFK